MGDKHAALQHQLFPVVCLEQIPTRTRLGSQCPSTSLIFETCPHRNTETAGDAAGSDLGSWKPRSVETADCSRRRAGAAGGRAEQLSCDTPGGARNSWESSGYELEHLSGASPREVTPAPTCHCPSHGVCGFIGIQGHQGGGRGFGISTPHGGEKRPEVPVSGVGRGGNSGVIGSHLV